jgi:hypothetical protein
MLAILRASGAQMCKSAQKWAKMKASGVLRLPWVRRLILLVGDREVGPL